MRIESLRIENFRVFSDVTIPFNNYACFVGANGAGKSTVIYALNVFFQDRSSCKSPEVLKEEDFHNRDTTKPVRITVTFCELSDEAQKDFKHYFRQGKLVVTSEARWNPANSQANVIQLGQRLGMAEFRPYFEGLEDKSKRVTDLKLIYNELRTIRMELPAPGSKEQMTDALQRYEENHPDECILIPSEDQFYGISRGTNLLEKYVQWIFVPAVKDATDEEAEEKNSALGKLLARTVRAKTNFETEIAQLRDEAQRKYQEILERNQHTLRDISSALESRMSEWAHPNVTLNLQWRRDQRSISISDPIAGVIAGEGQFSGSISRFGHGFQRSYLLSILHELSGCHSLDGPTLLLAIEEPELYQHPPQIRHLSEVLSKLSESNNQVIVCTHSPAFVSGESFQDVRMVRKASLFSQVACRTHIEIAELITNAQSELYSRSATGIRAKINQALQPSLNEIFFAPVLILVEGLEDIAHITTYLIRMDLWGRFRRRGCHIVAAQGKSNLILPVAVTEALGIPTFLVFDADGSSRPIDRPKHEKDNRTLLKLINVSSDPFPAATIWHRNVVVWPNNIGDSVREEFDEHAYNDAKNRVCSYFDQTPGLQKNDLFIAELLNRLWDSGHKSGSLQNLCESIVAFAESSTP